MAVIKDLVPTILVVDDYVENTLILEQFLHHQGYDVVTAHDGEEAIDLTEKSAPDVILLDLLLPKMDGFDVCRKLKQERKTRHIPIIIITGLAEREANVRALEAGADDFLVKPFDSVLLGARIRASLRSKFLQDQINEYQMRLEIYNDTLEHRIQERTLQLTHAQQITVFSLAKLAESRDTETGAHLDRIRAYTREIAQELYEKKEGRPFGANFITEIYMSSPLHDIGKVGIPDRILLKPGKLTAQEFNIMKAHSLIGGDTLKAADQEAGEGSFLAMGRDIAYFHHERWDGKGYPSGLVGTAIPMAARIVAVSDVYDALTSKRPYKEAWPHERAREVILEERGKGFDPDVVDAFLARENAILAIRAESADTDAPAHLMRLNQELEAAAYA
ncbi:MAG: response regulator [Candidatus Hydrogenedentes bacterium]|nr:response regulator [Candidatus Hydrogenedentota bacterium]